MDPHRALVVAPELDLEFLHVEAAGAQPVDQEDEDFLCLLLGVVL